MWCYGKILLVHDWYILTPTSLNDFSWHLTVQRFYLFLVSCIRTYSLTIQSLLDIWTWYLLLIFFQRFSRFLITYHPCHLFLILNLNCSIEYRVTDTRRDLLSVFVLKSTNVFSVPMYSTTNQTTNSFYHFLDLKSKLFLMVLRTLCPHLHCNHCIYGPLRAHMNQLHKI